MDDIKLLAMNERDFDSLIHTTRQAVSKRGEVLITKGVEQPKGNIADAQETTSEIPVQKRAILRAAKMPSSTLLRTWA